MSVHILRIHILHRIGHTDSEIIESSVRDEPNRSSEAACCVGICYCVASRRAIACSFTTRLVEQCRTSSASLIVVVAAAAASAAVAATAAATAAAAVVVTDGFHRIEIADTPP